MHNRSFLVIYIIASLLLVTNCSKDNEQSYQIEIEIAPNPNNGTFTLKGNKLTGKDITLSIYNSLSQNIYTEQIFKSETLIKTNLISGNYEYQINQSNKKIASGKLAVY